MLVCALIGKAVTLPRWLLHLLAALLTTTVFWVFSPGKFLLIQVPLRAREFTSSIVISTRVNADLMRGGLWEFSTDHRTLHPPTRCRHLWGIGGVSPACAFLLRLAAGAPARLCYYLKESKGSRRWLLFLEGGWYCFNRENCDSRYSTMRRLMSSKDWPHTRTGTGILSSQPEENPHWWNANMVFIPYCSSDVWSGASPKSDKNEYAFMGSLIIQEVVRELLGKGLSGAKVLLLAGSSAGGTGVLLNVDRVAELLEELGYPSIQVRGLADSGWFLDNKQYRRSDCIDTINCAPTDAIRRGIRYWSGMVPERCQRQFKEGEEWNCFFGYKVYPTLRCPVFVVQWLFDEAQLTVDNVHLTGQPVQEGQWLYIQNLGRELRGTLKDVQASFAPACLSHEIIIRSYWTDVQVKGTSLPRALHCWDRSFHDSHKASKTPMKGCPFHLVDSCPWPHCNPSCPTIRDQFTGQEMNVAQFLMHMGFDVQTVAQQQGMEPSKLLGMLSNGN
ncbi:palmitoleoyl-protein carboxylesterase NOTUM isoform X1 [Mus musculus]|uniref:palmitoleoyl-protein carboxylesterase NOTUM isoform X1 n=1 Tax=Mus musculus TaxID=10090 RepID=UPI0005AB9FC0|nr:palmitoleoyl-protein carboxylesterase NOTUM isoform X1 [Mus musculus]|eukprot:XP_011247617.1 PREDICTED: palmitoleoyl-protein carboxylesterase NOTUM isoform X3 [Mus musculus]